MHFFRTILISFTVILSLISHRACADSALQEAMCQDLTTIQEIFESSYAPSQWKKDYSQWDLSSEIQGAKDSIRQAESLSIRDYQKLARSLIQGSQDYHVAIRFYSTESAYLPFSIRGSQGRYFIRAIDREMLSASSFPFDEGDEIIEFDGLSTYEAVQTLRQQEIGFNTEDSDQRLAEIFLTRRMGAAGHAVPHGPVSIAVRIMTGEVKRHQLIWQHQPEAIRSPLFQSPEIVYAPPQSSFVESPAKQLKKALSRTTMLSPHYESLLQSFADRDPQAHTLGARNSFLPPLGRIWWHGGPNLPFDCYIYETAQKKLLGYLRIPHYGAGSYEADIFRQIIDLFEERTDALVIDQLDNPGGSVFYLYALASMLSDQPLETPRHRIMLTQEDVYFAKLLLEWSEDLRGDEEAQGLLGDNIAGYPVNHQFIQFLVEYCRTVINEWNAGNRLSKPVHLWGVDHINPHPSSRYTKPILVLVNELDFSGGDFFPAILQDNGRAKIMGNRTAGAGGFIGIARWPNRLGISGLRLTRSLAERSDKQPLENLGVTPDIPYQISPYDLQTGCIEFAVRIDDVLKGICSGEEDEEVDPFWLEEN